MCDPRKDNLDRIAAEARLRDRRAPPRIRKGCIGWPFPVGFVLDKDGLKPCIVKLMAEVAIDFVHKQCADMRKVEAIKRAVARYHPDLHFPEDHRLRPREDHLPWYKRDTP